MITIIFFSKENSVCSSNDDCHEDKRYASCDTEKKSCKCMEGYEENEYGNCVKKVTVGESCNNIYEICEGENQECDSQICSCKRWYTYSSKNKKCEVTIKYGETCDDDICEKNKNVEMIQNVHV